MSRTTRATQLLSKAGIAYETITYDYNPNAERVGLQAAEAIGELPSIVYKTLMLELDGKPVCAVIASDREVSMKKLATALGGKTANMMKPTLAERITGYFVGGISPLGQKKLVPTVFDEHALQLDYFYINGGQRGLQIRIHPRDVITITQAVVAPLTAD